jgi:hypothetical protein
MRHLEMALPVSKRQADASTKARAAAADQRARDALVSIDM